MADLISESEVRITYFFFSSKVTTKQVIMGEH